MLMAGANDPPSNSTPLQPWSTEQIVKLFLCLKPPTENKEAFDALELEAADEEWSGYYFPRDGFFQDFDLAAKSSCTSRVVAMSKKRSQSDCHAPQTVLAELWSQVPDEFKSAERLACSGGSSWAAGGR